MATKYQRTVSRAVYEWVNVVVRIFNATRHPRHIEAAAWVNTSVDLVYEWVHFFKGQVYDWGRFRNTGLNTRTTITRKLPARLPPPHALHSETGHNKRSKRVNVKGNNSYNSLFMWMYPRNRVPNCVIFISVYLYLWEHFMCQIK